MSKKHAEQILCQSVSSVCNYIFDIRTKGHMFLTQRRKVSQSVCVRWSHTESTEFLHGLAHIYKYFYEPLMARIFTNALRGI